MKITLTYAGEDNHCLNFYDTNLDITVSHLTTEDLRLIRDRADYFIGVSEEKETLKNLQEKTIQYIWNDETKRHEKLEK